jgi:multidrug efflux system membrane fusion protein
MRRAAYAPALALSILAAGMLAGCKQQNEYKPPPPAKVGVATPLDTKVTLYMSETGNVVSLNTVNLVARVPGFLREIDYEDGAFVKKGTTLFVIEQPPYQAQFQQAQSQLAAAKAELVQAEAEFVRQSTLVTTDATSQSKVDVARAKRDSDAAQVQNADAALQIAAINLSYTQVTAPFDGVVTAHEKAIGALVGEGGPTQLATIVSLDPIYVTFTVSEQDVQRIRDSMRARGIKAIGVGKLEIGVGLQTEDGYPHTGVLDYIDPQVNPATGTLTARVRLDNPDHLLLPGYFARLHIPLQKDVPALLVPDQVIGTDQAGKYVLVVGADNKVEQRRVELGQLQGNLRIITKGLGPTDKVVVGNVQRAIPGAVVAPEAATIKNTIPSN